MWCRIDYTYLRKILGRNLKATKLSKMTFYFLYSNNMITGEIQNYCNPGKTCYLQLPNPGIGCDLRRSKSRNKVKWWFYHYYFPIISITTVLLVLEQVHLFPPLSASVSAISIYLIGHWSYDDLHDHHFHQLSLSLN